MKHVVVESKPDSVAHVMYHITPNGPYFDSLYSLIEEARTTAIIQNHAFDLILGSSPPKVSIIWNVFLKIYSILCLVKQQLASSKHKVFFAGACHNEK